jgi:hypothetical protein
VSGDDTHTTIHVEVDEAAMHETIRRFLRKTSAERGKPEPEPVTIPGVPTSIPRETACGLIRALGIEPFQLRSLSFDLMGIHLEVYALNPEGRRFTADGENIATHRMTIAITDDPPKPASDS